MPAQCRGRRDAEDEVDPLARHQSMHLGPAIVAVGADQDPRLGPVGADRPQQAAQVSPDLLPAGPFGRTQHGRDEPALAIEHDDRLEAIFVIMGVEQPQLLTAVNGVERVVDVEHDPLGHLSE